MDELKNNFSALTLLVKQQERQPGVLAWLYVCVKVQICVWSS